MAATRGPRTFAKASQHLEIGRQPLLPDEPDKSFRLNDREDAGEADLLPLTSRSNDISVEDTPSLVTQALAAAFYAGASLTVIFVNKVQYSYDGLVWRNISVQTLFCSRGVSRKYCI